MKKAFAILLAAMLSVSVAACGNDKSDNANGSASGSGAVDNGAGSGAMDGGAGSSAIDNGAGSGALDGGAGSGSTTSDGLTDDRLTGTGDAENGSGSGATPQSSKLPGATYGQMLRNSRVHDADGYLLDGENAVTPGALR